MPKVKSQTKVSPCSNPRKLSFTFVPFSSQPLPYRQPTSLDLIFGSKGGDSFACRQYYIDRSRLYKKCRIKTTLIHTSPATSGAQHLVEMSSDFCAKVHVAYVVLVTQKAIQQYAMKCCTKMPCPLPHNHYCCLLPSPICLLHLLICTCLISSPIACPPWSVLCWCLLCFFIFFYIYLFILFLFLLYATFLCDSILACFCTYFLFRFYFCVILPFFWLADVFLISWLYCFSIVGWNVLLPPYRKKFSSTQSANRKIGY